MRQPSRSAPLIRRFAACVFPFAASCANELVGPNSTTVPIAVRTAFTKMASGLSWPWPRVSVLCPLSREQSTRRDRKSVV